MTHVGNAIWISDPTILWTGTVLLAISTMAFIIWPLSPITVEPRVIPLACLGLLAGLHGASYGAYKDSPHESFRGRRFARELAIAFLAALTLASFDLNGSQCLFVLFVTTFAVTRIVTEFWKLFVRTEPQQEYRIPTQFHWVRGVVQRPWIRLLVGLGFLGSIYGLYCLFTLLPHGLPKAIRALIVGAGFGMAEAIAGAYKDGCIEGFSAKKFWLKSPVFCALGGWIASWHTDNLIYLMLAAYGTSRMSLELFFKILVPGYAPGKFRSVTGSFVEWTRHRKYFLLPYGVTWLFWLGLQWR